ncbi:MAG: rane fusion protein multidrug efflux system [Rhodospirillaceae bacterium]|jgi:membrane fusion protein (multidrug efflux system)|nr:rane fusion protein multidrug efflux system [Rhodospirillaceae bacterium]
MNATVDTNHPATHGGLVSALGRRKRSWRQRLRLPLMLAAPIVIALVGGYFYLTGGRYVSTDDAYVQAARISISTNVPGRVIEVDVRDNQEVQKGDILFRLDDRPYRIAVEEAQAQLASARLQVEAEKATYGQKVADARSAQDTLAYQQREFDRQKRLLASGVASQAQFDQASHALQNARQQLASNQQQIAQVLANLGGDSDIPVERHPSVQQAQAQLDRANLNLSYTVIPAPEDGVVTKVEQIHVGTYINAAVPAFSLVSNRDIWVEANFKETDLTRMRPGQTATIDIDTYPDKTFTAKVVSVSPGTGSVFSVLPPENATGNWVKVVQRLAVRLEIENADPALPLHAGLSATVDVDTRHQRRLLTAIHAAFASTRSGK